MSKAKSTIRLFFSVSGGRSRSNKSPTVPILYQSGDWAVTRCYDLDGDTYKPIERKTYQVVHVYTGLSLPYCEQAVKRNAERLCRRMEWFKFRTDKGPEWEAGKAKAKAICEEAQKW